MKRLLVAPVFLLLASGCRHVRPYRDYAPVITPAGSLERISSPDPGKLPSVSPVAGEPALEEVREPPRIEEAKSLSQWIDEMAAALADAYFDYDRFGLRPDAQAALDRDAALLGPWFSLFPEAGVIIEGHCDERGSAEYNLALGDLRAQAAKDFLQQRGVPVERMRTISYGREKPQCSSAQESCWQKNRRAHVVVSPAR